MGVGQNTTLGFQQRNHSMISIFTQRFITWKLEHRLSDLFGRKSQEASWCHCTDPWAAPHIWNNFQGKDHQKVMMVHSSYLYICLSYVLCPVGSRITGHMHHRYWGWVAVQSHFGLISPLCLTCFPVISPLYRTCSMFSDHLHLHDEVNIFTHHRYKWLRRHRGMFQMVEEETMHKRNQSWVL